MNRWIAAYVIESLCVVATEEAPAYEAVFDTEENFKGSRVLFNSSATEDTNEAYWHGFVNARYGSQLADEAEIESAVDEHMAAWQKSSERWREYLTQGVAFTTARLEHSDAEDAAEAAGEDAGTKYPLVAERLGKWFEERDEDATSNVNTTLLKQVVAHMNDREALRARVVADDVALSVPLGHRSLAKAWGMLQSFTTLTVVPKEIFFFSEDDKETVDDSELWYFFRALLKEVYVPLLPEATTVVWGAYPSPGSASVGRWMGSKYATLPYIVYVDSDDYLVFRAFEIMPSVLRARDDVDLILSGYGTWDPYKELNKKLLAKKPLTDDQLAEVMYFADDTTYKEVFGTQETTAQIYLALLEGILGAQAWGEEKVKQRLIHSKAPLSQSEEMMREFYPTSQQNGTYNPQVFSHLPNFNIISANRCKYITKRLRSKKAELEARHAKYNAEWEKQDEEFLRKMCAEDHDRSPHYVQNCANGWGAVRTSVMRRTPPNILIYGEDALYNYMAMASGANVTCVGDYALGIYKTYKNRYLDEVLAGTEQYRNRVAGVSSTTEQ